MKLSCTPISLARELKSGAMDLRGFVDFCAEQGIDGVDLLDTECYPWLWEGPATDLKTAARHIEQAGLGLAAYACGNNFALGDPAAHDQQVDVVTSAIREAAEAGAPVLRIFGGHLNGPDGRVPPHAGMRLVKAGIEKCLPEAEKHGVVLALENHGALPGHAFELAALFRTFNSPWLRCTFDCANFIAWNMPEAEDPVRALETLLPWLAHVHVKDMVRVPIATDAGLGWAKVAGQGHVPIKQLTAITESSGYDGYYSLEYEAAHEVPEREGVAESFRYLKEVSLLHEELGLNSSR